MKHFVQDLSQGIVPVNQINKKKYSLKKNPITKELTNFYNNLF